MKVLRCAVYTRKSTEHGLDQAFNSLEAQREASEAYVKSQAHEGWRLLPERYDDGGISGGTLDRPGLQRLLSEVRAGRVDVIVVYKVDRLTRSLADFAKLVELFDGHGVSFVSVTQAFNTTTSMGRLTLNVLLSFAQFEREVTGERIRDKIAASKKKGIRVGGPVPLGYRVEDKKLVVDEAEARTVRAIFEGYLERGCLKGLAQELRAKGVITKVSRKRDGTLRGGLPFTTGPLAYLLHNRVYRGELVHKGRYVKGAHEAIVSEELFEAVQGALSGKAGRDRVRLGAHLWPLAGLLFDDRGQPMRAGSAKKSGARYRYYVSAALTRGQTGAAGSIPRVPAPEIEAVILEALRIEGQPSEEHGTPVDIHEVLASRVERIVVRPGTIEIEPKEDGKRTGTLLIPWSPPARTRQRQVIRAGETESSRPIRAETRARLLEGIAKARAWMEELASGRVSSTAAIAARERVSERSVRMTLNLAFLSPTLVRAAVDGTLPDGLGITSLAEAPPSWTAQERLGRGA